MLTSVLLFARNLEKLTHALRYYSKLYFWQLMKKLAGEAEGTGAWCTNVGNEHGEILMSVLTSTEGEGLHKMGQGLVNR